VLRQTAGASRQVFAKAVFSPLGKPAPWRHAAKAANAHSRKNKRLKVKAKKGRAK